MLGQRGAFSSGGSQDWQKFLRISGVNFDGEGATRTEIAQLVRTPVGAYDETFAPWLIRRAREELVKCLITDVVELWTHIYAVRLLPLLAAVICTLHYLGLLFFRIRSGVFDSQTAVMATIALVNVNSSYMISTWHTWSPTNRRSLVVILSFAYTFMPCLAIIINAQMGRSSEAALFDSVIFTSNQFFLNRSTPMRIVMNFISCFSWHFWKRAVPSILDERGKNLPHLLYALAIYCVSIYASFKLQPSIDLEIERRKLHEKANVHRQG